MKYILSFILIFTSLNTFALPLPPDFEGIYRFNGQIQTLNTLKKEVIYTHNDNGKIKLSDLRKQGYLCSIVQSNIYYCALNTNDDLPLRLKNKLVSDYSSVSISFLNSAGDWALVQNADSLTVFEKHQKVNFNGKLYTKLSYLMLTGLNKLVLENSSNDKVWLNLDSTGSLQLPLEQSETLDKTRFNIYLVSLGFN